MSIKFYDKYNQLISEETGNTGRCEEKTLSRNMIIYVEVQNGETTIDFEVKDKNVKKWFPYQYDDGAELVSYTRNLKPGKYRIILPTTKNEDELAIIFKNKGTETNANFYIVPNFTQF